MGEKGWENPGVSPTAWDFSKAKNGKINVSF
jgi:hypothetical protein